MALSGSFNTNSVDGYYLTFSWSATQSIANNKSTVSWTLSFGGSSGYADVFSRKVTAGGTVRYGYGYPYDNNYPQDRYTVGSTIRSGSFEVTHNADGTGSFAVSVEANIIYSYPYLGYYNATASRTITLDTIARGASITSAPDFNDQQNPVLQYSNPAGTSATVQAAISLDGSTANISYRAVSQTGSSYTFNLTTAERNILRNATTGASRTVYYLLKTTIGSNTFTTSKSATFTVSNTSDTKPTVSNSATPDNTAIPSTYRSTYDGMYVQNFSKAVVTVTASAKYSASITGYNTSLNGKNYSGASFTSDIIDAAGTLALKSTVTDSRGYTNSDSRNLTVYSYTSPAISGASVFRCNSSGTASDSGTSIKIVATRVYASVNSKNRAILRYRYKLSTASSWGSWQTLIARTTTNTNTYSAVISGTFAVTNSYNFQISVLDDFGKEALQGFDVPTEVVTFHMKEGGLALGFGTYAGNDESITFAWKPKFTSSSISEFSSNPPYLLGIESFASGGEMKWKSANSTAVGKLLTPRSIGLGTDMSGSANFDGSGNITISARNYYSSIDSNNTANYQWHRIATTSVGTGQYQDRDVILDLRRSFNGGTFGRIKISLRTNSSGVGVSCSATWLYRYGIAANDICIAWWGVTGNDVYADVFWRVETWARGRIYQFQGDRTFTLISSKEASDTTASDRKSSTECWASISAAATALHGKAYTGTSYGVDGGVVGTANKLGSVTVGAANQPIYLNDGVPAAATTVSTTTSGIVTRSGGLGIQSQKGDYWGRVAQLTLTLNGDGAWHNKGDNIFTGTIASGWRPKSDIMGVGYYSDMVYTGWITSGGAITIRLTGYSSGVTFTSGSPVIISWTYLW